MKVVILASNMTESVRNIKTFDAAQLYKACAYKDGESFVMVREWNAAHGTVRAWCKTTGAKSSMNSHLSDVLGVPVYRKSVFCLLGPSGEAYVDFEPPAWKAFAQNNIYAATEGDKKGDGDHKNDAAVVGNTNSNHPLNVLPSNEHDEIMPQPEYDNDGNGNGNGEDADEDGDEDADENGADADEDPDGDGDEEDGDEEDGNGDEDEGDEDDGEGDADDDENGCGGGGGGGGGDASEEMGGALPSLLGRAFNVIVALDQSEATNVDEVEQLGLLTMNELSDDEYFPYSDGEADQAPAH